jgi:hypothetical protein
MRKLFIGIAVTTVIAAAGTLGWQAEAANPAAPVPQAAPYTPIHPAACRGPGEYCAPGRHHVCGPYGKHCWCAPC